jgi:hypothetical protein
MQLLLDSVNDRASQKASREQGEAPRLFVALDEINNYLKRVLTERCGQTLGPFDHSNPLQSQSFFDPSLAQVLTGQAVQVQMMQRQPSMMFMD